MKIIKILLCGLLLVACSSNNQKESTDTEVKSSETVSETVYPIEIKHAFGTTIIESEPKNVVTIAWSNQDVPLALNIVPTGVSKANFGKTEENGLLPWTSKKFVELNVSNPNVFDDVDGLDFEAISNAQPDVILAAYSGITEEEYKLLSEIAPVVAYKEKPWQTYWRENIIENSTALGKLEEGKMLVSQLESLIAEKVQKYPNVKGKKVAFTYFNTSDLSNFFVYMPTDPRANYLIDLGMVFTDEVLALNVEGQFYAQVSAEKVDVLNSADIIVVYGDENTLKLLQDDKIVGSVPAIQRGSVVVLNNDSSLAASATPSALSIPATIDEYLKLFEEAALLVK